jgi:enoyl-CoA hydratase
MRVASEEEHSGLPEAGLSIISAAGGIHTLPRNAGRGKVLEMVLSGRRFDAKEAYQFHLVNRVPMLSLD